MAEPNDKWEDNVDGFSIVAGKKVSFYVDRECILCSVCEEVAPKNFRMNDTIKIVVIIGSQRRRPVEKLRLRCLNISL